MNRQTYPNEIAVKLGKLLKEEERTLDRLRNSNKPSPFLITQQEERVGRLNYLYNLGLGYGNLYYWNDLRHQLIQLTEKDPCMTSVMVMLGSDDYRNRGSIWLPKMLLKNV